MRYIIITIFILLLSSCSQRTTPYIKIVNKAISNAQPIGKKVLKAGHYLAYKRSKTVRGSCWDYINKIYNYAGYRHSKQIIFKSTKRGPYAHKYMIKAGDWLYYINYDYHGVEHSAIFVAWMDVERSRALMLSYKGGRSSNPARYKIYNISSVYRITRGK